MFFILPFKNLFQTKGDQYKMKKILFAFLAAALTFALVKPLPMSAEEKMSNTQAVVKPVTVTKVKIKNKPVTYPQISHVKDQNARKKINEFLKTKGLNAAKAYTKFKATEAKDKAEWDDSLGEWWGYEYDYSYKVKYNENNQLSVIFYTYTYLGGAHGMTTGQSYNFDVKTGKMYKLTTTINGKATAVKEAAFNTLSKQYDYELFIEKPSEIVLNDRTTLWTFDKKGIKLIFSQYEVLPYAAGMPEVVIPSSVYTN